MSAEGHTLAAAAPAPEGGAEQHPAVPADAKVPSETGSTHSRVSHTYDYQHNTDPKVVEMLQKEAKWAVELLERLTHTSGDNAMKPGICNACEGLAFIKVAKGGLGITWAHGTGFVIHKLQQDRFGHSLWSAPVFFGVSQLGLGIAAGYESVESCLALMNRHSVLSFTHDKTVVGTDLLLFSTDAGMCGVSAGTFGRMSQMDVAADNQSTSFCYSIASGVLVNLSINGTETRPNHDLNTKLYGSTPLEEVLRGTVPTFEPLMPLYRKIQELASKALA